ncbi:uncharacterized protein EDB91DRAFT_1241564 [Suillus paluster]|uniref:uncharacterized protein n=1 Tax=Suillus paluster TaxID=48578 RepID=UPI001B86E5CF|nr:uncharacterized protein EDB91DRAFT_1241564 [Suillus paluster]KAG1756511.1 hypothetical protein EDB91DRAFT_1241564 [Suillus paluster]
MELAHASPEVPLAIMQAMYSSKNMADSSRDELSRIPDDLSVKKSQQIMTLLDSVAAISINEHCGQVIAVSLSLPTRKPASFTWQLTTVFLKAFQHIYRGSFLSSEPYAPPFKHLCKNGTTRRTP